ncbi:hypothetical protein B4Q13_16605, partial [Lacticaseibacillus rhamnosus]
MALRCSPFHTASAFHPIIEHLKRVFGWQPEDTASQHFAKLEAGLYVRAMPAMRVVSNRRLRVGDEAKAERRVQARQPAQIAAFQKCIDVRPDRPMTRVDLDRRRMRLEHVPHRSGATRAQP